MNHEGKKHVLVDFCDVAKHIDFKSDVPYKLSGMDTLNPILTIDGKFKLVGEYIETTGTSIFSEEVVFTGENQTPKKVLKVVDNTHKTLKFSTYEVIGDLSS